MLETIDDVRWAELDGAHGSAVGVPALMRTLAAGGPAADEAAAELVDELHHQGTVWSVTAPAVPFVVELALAESVPHRDSLLYLLARLSSTSSVGPVVGEHVGRMLPLLDDPDPAVRETAGHLLGQHNRSADVIVPALLDRWPVESVPLVRASLLAAIGSLDVEQGKVLATRALKDPEPAVRAAAGLVLRWMRQWWPKGRVKWPAHAADVVVSAFADGDPLRGWAWAGDAVSELLDTFTDDIERNPDRIPAAMLRLLVRSPSAQVRRYTVMSISDINNRSRSAPARLVPMLVPLLADPDQSVRQRAAGAIGQAGSAAAVAAGELAALAADLGTDTGARVDAEIALGVLIGLGDRRWQPTLLAAWRDDRPRGVLAGMLYRARPPFDGDLFAAVRNRLAALAASEPARGEVDNLIRVLTPWGPRAAAAVPDLTGILAAELERERIVAATVCHALAALGPDALPAVPMMRAVVGKGFRTYDRIGAASAIWTLTGEPEPLLASVGAWLASDDARNEIHHVHRLTPLGPQAAPALPALRAHLVEHPQRLATNSEIARVLWQLDHDPDEILPTLREALSVTGGSRYNANSGPPTAAIETAADLGPAGTPLIPLLRATLPERTSWKRVAVAGALWRLGDMDTTELVATILPPPAGFEHWDHSSADRALDLVSAARAIEAVPRLQEYLATDRRVMFGNPDDAVRLDELLCARLEHLVRDLAGAVAPGLPPQPGD